MMAVRTELKARTHPPTLWLQGLRGVWRFPVMNQTQPLSGCSCNLPGAPGTAMGGKHLALREGPSWRRTLTAGKVESFIESLKYSVWSPTWSRKASVLEVNFLPR